MTPILSGLAQGYAADEILNYIKKAFPKMKPMINQAAGVGYNSNQILKYVNGLMEKSTYPSHLSIPERESIRRQKQNDLAKKLLGAGASFAATSAFAAKIPNLLKTAGTAAFGGNQPGGNPPGGSPPGGPGSGIGPTPMSNAPVQPASPNAPTPNITPPSPISPQGQQRSASIAQINRMTPEFRAYANQQIAEGNEKPVEEMLDDFEKSQKKQPSLMQGIEQDVQNMVNKKTTIPEKPLELKKEKGSLIATPSGDVGHIKNIRETEALIDEDGKVKKVKLEDAFPVPEDIQNKDFSDIANDYISKFPKEGEGSLSDALSVLSYNPETKQMFVVFPDSPHMMGQYDNVEPEDYETIIAANTKPKTSGGTGIPGTWDVNTADSRGSPFRKISTDPAKYPYSKFPIGYNMMHKLLEAIKEMRKNKRREQRKKPNG